VRTQTKGIIISSVFLISSFVGLSAVERIAVFFALEADRNQFETHLDFENSRDEQSIHKISVFESTERIVYTALMGSGPVNTALSAQEVLVTYSIDAAFSVGPVGGLANNVEVGEWLEVSRVLPWQMDFDPSSSGPSSRSRSLTLNALPRDRVFLPKSDIKRVNVASGEAFIDSDVARDLLRGATGAEVVDMNLFGLIEALNRRNIPSWHLRVVSDLANDQASAQFLKFVKQYDGQGGEMLAEVINRLKPDPNSPSSYPGLRSLLD